ncbi:ATP synthase subunit ATP5MPL, mitochondrial-like [Physeter macrocephalus]|uniref:ATP synthase subunit ATP5MPL, mitochondrial-like n=1 Tax=Physeter macrocephalus TaxID=9755 RepID=A0A9W2X2M5_PHYMC|nr:ATP synthase subunit ATP5MPL, mitochondrial-like [Physeter catodon]
MPQSLIKHAWVPRKPYSTQVYQKMWGRMGSMGSTSSKRVSADERSKALKAWGPAPAYGHYESVERGPTWAHVA